MSWSDYCTFAERFHTGEDGYDGYDHLYRWYTAPSSAVTKKVVEYPAAAYMRSP
jgi:hypothetical protein